jgi:hypothetical protein
VALSLTSAITVKSRKTATSGSQTKADEHSTSARRSWTDGTGAGAANKEYDTGLATLGGSADSIDLSGSLVNAINESVVFTKVALFELYCPSTNTGTVNFGGGSTPWNTAIIGTLAMPPGSRLLCQAEVGTVWTVSAGTADLLRVSGTSGDKYQVFLAGE